MVVSIEIDGKPFGKQRPRYNGRIAYTPKPTRIYEQAVKSAWRAKNVPMMQGYINLYIDAKFPVPASDPKWKKAAKLAGVIKPSKPDWDNIGKITDALNGLAWADDSLVELALVTKRYAEQAGVTITIVSTDPIEERIAKFRRAYDSAGN